MKNFLKLIPEEYKDDIEKKAFPDWIPPMLATLTKEHFSNPEWIYERKLDGERIFVYKNGDKVSLKTRNEKLANAAYPNIIKQLKKMNVKQCVLDGEVVAFEGNLTSFKKLQKVMHIQNEEKARSRGIKTYYYVFDILYLNGYQLTDLPLKIRKKILLHMTSYRNLKDIRYMPHRVETGIRYYKEACKKGWEGVIAKNYNAIYEHKRSKEWLKFKCGNQQEFVIAGYTQPGGGRAGFGALLLGYYEQGKLKYAGKVGTGFDEDLLVQLLKKMEKLEVKQSPFSNYDENKKSIHYIKPKLVGEIRFEEWTDDNRLRHPSFLGLRDDKDAKDVVRERCAK